MALPKTSKTETMNVTEARRNFSDTLDRVRRGEARVILEKSGIPVGALISPNDLETLSRLEARRTEQWDGVQRLREAFADVSEEELDAEIVKALASAREEDGRSAK